MVWLPTIAEFDVTTVVSTYLDLKDAKHK